jgi:signal transduction histidine kinase
VEAAAEVPNGQVEITTFVEEGFWVLAVSDSGRGIDAAIREQIFQPFVTGKPNGTGLGLFVVSERVRELSGTLECRSQLDHGSTFEVRLPIAKRSESLSTT